MNASIPYEVIVLGGGKGGKTLATELGNKGVKTALIERSADMIGGTCINLHSNEDPDRQRASSAGGAEGRRFRHSHRRYHGGLVGRSKPNRERCGHYACDESQKLH